MTTTKVDSKRVRALKSGKFELAYRLPGSPNINRLEYDTEKEAREHAANMEAPKRETKPKVALSSVVGAGFSLKAESVGKDDVIKKTTPGRKDNAPRDADQKQVDRDVKLNYIKNRQQGKTSAHKFDEHTLSQYIVPPKATDVVLDMLRRATGSGGPATGKTLRYRKGTHASGNTRIQWSVVDSVK